MRLDGYLAAARLAAGVPRFLRHRLDVAEARAIVERRRRSRGVDFLALARAAVYGHATSPYRALLAAAGCEYGDLAALVEREGLDTALAALLRAGVYVTVEELKGRRPIVRGSVVIEARPAAFENPALHRHDLVRTSGSRGIPAAVPYTLEFFEDIVVDMRLTLDTWGPGPWSLAYWDVPGGMSFFLLTYPPCGVIPDRWFSPVSATDGAVASRYSWSARALRWAARAAGVRLPAPETVRVTAPLEIARWMSASLARGATPLLLTYPSPAVRLCRAAAAADIDLTGTQLRLYGEPLTAARLDVIRRSGADARTIYATMEVFRVGDACLCPEAADEVHVFDAGVVTVERRQPFATATGKIHHVHAPPRAATSRAGPSPGGP